MILEGRRLVSVTSTIDKGLRAPIPPILHVCSESRSISLKHYTLSFGNTELKYEHIYSPYSPPRLYFNSDNDVLYFGQDWNGGVEGEWSCISCFMNLFTDSELQKVKSVGFALNAKACSQLAWHHPPDLREWNGLETLYLVMDEPSGEFTGEREIRDLREEDHPEFLKAYHGFQDALRRGIYDVEEYITSIDQATEQKNSCEKYLGQNFLSDEAEIVIRLARIVDF